MRPDVLGRVMRVRLVCITMLGADYVLCERDGGAFPHGELAPAEPPAEAARRVVLEWTGTRAPKLELVDLRADAEGLLLVFRAMLTETPTTPTLKAARMSLPARVGALAGPDVEEMLKTSLAYKLTRG